MTQISMEDAFPTFQKKTHELFESNLLLQAQVDVLERQLAAAREENTRLKETNGHHAPPAGGPDLAAMPPHPTDNNRQEHAQLTVPAKAAD